MTKLVGTIEAERTDQRASKKTNKENETDEETPKNDNKHLWKLASDELVPGDIVYLKNNTKAVCDMVILEGECLVDEAVLTGESVPCSKIQLPDNSDSFDKNKNNKNIIFCGSKIISASTHTGAKVKAIVYRTGFNSSKGSMVRDILFPKQQVFRHEKEANRLIFYLAGVVALMIVLYYYYAFYIHGLAEDEKVGYLLAGIDMMLTGIPPGLSLCLMLGVHFGVENLQNDGIDCF